MAGTKTLRGYSSSSFTVDANTVAAAYGEGIYQQPEGTQVLSKVQVALTSPQELVTLSYQIDFEVYEIYSEGFLLTSVLKSRVVSTTNLTDLLPVTGSD